MCKLFHISLVLISISLSATSQTLIPMNCGTSTTKEDIEKLIINKNRSLTFDHRTFETTYIPVQFHLVATSNGGGRISPDRVFEGLCKLNEDFAPTGLQFYFSGEFEYIDNNAMYDMEYPPIPSGVRTLFTLRRVDGAVNIFIGNGLASGNSGFYTSSPDVIYMDKSYVNDKDVILSHELGHFLGLAHTFFGWESTEYNPDEPTPTQVFRGSTAYDVEYVDREKNCESSGDFFCGTPADYITDWNGGCDYTGGAVDPDSVLIDPDERNIMSYYSFNGCEQYVFAEDQSAAMIANYMNRSEFNGTNIEMQNAITDSILLNGPSNEEEVAFNNVELSWQATANASTYIVEVSRILNFFALDVRQLTKETTLLVEDLKEDKKYYWRVRALNETNFCMIPKSETEIFRTVEMASSTSSDAVSKSLVLFPNPIKTGDFLTIHSTIDAQKVNLIIYNAAGHLLSSKFINLKKGNNTTNHASNLPAGIYYVSIKGEKIDRCTKLLIH